MEATGGRANLLIMAYWLGRAGALRWKSIAVAALCLLVVAFAFEAKLALYQPQSAQIHPVSAGKLWQTGARAAETVELELDAVQGLLFAVIALQLLLPSLLSRRIPVPVSPLALQSRVISPHGLLRAPPRY